MMLEPDWIRVAERIRGWLAGLFPEPATSY